LFYLDSLQLRGFRNYHNQHINFHRRFNIFVGDNGQGKTNLLEAIYYLSVTRSFRTKRDFELVNFEDRFFYLSGIFIKSFISHKVQMSYQINESLQVKIDNNLTDRFNHLQRFPVITFSPDDLQIIRDGPAVRRRFLNLEGSRLNPLFFQELKKYQRVLIQRNNLLRDMASRNKIEKYIEPWNQALIEHGSRIIIERIKLMKILQEEASPFFKEMSGSSEELTLKYRSNLKIDVDLDDYDKIRKNYEEILASKKDLELKRGSTQVGPHLDDFSILINGADSRFFSSQGQKRTAALALKMAEVNLFTRNNYEEPIILLDDVFSEFDDTRKKHLLTFLSNNSSQCFISSASGINEFIHNLPGEHKIFKITQGTVLDETDQ